MPCSRKELTLKSVGADTVLVDQTPSLVARIPSRFPPVHAAGQEIHEVQRAGSPRTSADPVAAAEGCHMYITYIRPV